MSATALAVSPATSTDTQSLQVIKRNGTLVGFNPAKIGVAVTKAFLAVEGDKAAGSARINDAVHRVTDQVVQAISRRLQAGGKVHIEDIQDQVELALMRAEEQKVARAYVLYREEHARQRAVDEPMEAHPHLTVKKADGSLAPLDLGLMKLQVEQAAAGLEGIDGASLVDEALRNLYDGIAETEVVSALIMTARGRIEQEPDYSAVTARLLLEQLRLENAEALDLPRNQPLAEVYPQALKALIRGNGTGVFLFETDRPFSVRQNNSAAVHALHDAGGGKHAAVGRRQNGQIRRGHRQDIRHGSVPTRARSVAGRAMGHIDVSSTISVLRGRRPGQHHHNQSKSSHTQSSCPQV